MTHNPPMQATPDEIGLKPCLKCEGNGWHTVRNPDPLLLGVFEVDCADCHRTGFVVQQA